MNNQKYIISFDISSRCIGWAVFVQEPDPVSWAYHDSGFLELDNTRSLYARAEQFEILLTDLMRQYERDDLTLACVAVEAPKVGFGTKTTAHTLATLQAFNAMCRYIIVRNTDIEPELVSESTARKGITKRNSDKTQKQQAGEWLASRWWLPEEYIQRKKGGDLKDTFLDMADAVLVGLVACLNAVVDEQLERVEQCVDRIENTIDHNFDLLNQKIEDILE